MRKFLLAVLAGVSAVGLAVAAEVSFVKYDKDTKALTVKDGDKEATYTITDDTKVKRGDADAKLKGALKYLEEKAQPGQKFEITVDADKKNVTEIKLKGKAK